MDDGKAVDCGREGRRDIESDEGKASESGLDRAGGPVIDKRGEAEGLMIPRGVSSSKAAWPSSEMMVSSTS